MIPDIKLSDYQYTLPKQRIRKHALTARDESKLITYHNGKFDHLFFKDIVSRIPEDSTIFFNNTKVIPARLRFTKSTGANIEIFLLSPVAPSTLVAEAMNVNHSCVWKCMIGNLKKWKNGTLTHSLNYKTNKFNLTAKLLDGKEKLVMFDWDGDLSFAEVVEAMGEVPLPPYFERKPVLEDKERYQTIYSNKKGAVAAPTAGLHFTQKVLEELAEKGAKLEYITLHVSAGTFQPVKEEDASKHPMHSEQVIVTKLNLKALVSAKQIYVVGTTTMRTLESLYWFGLKHMKNESADFHVHKLEPYDIGFEKLPHKKEVFAHLLAFMDKNNLDQLRGDSEIFIMPGYQFQVCDALITNFHQPGSTLLMLIAAFIGEDWKALYKEALANNYQFLSYGDSSLLIP